MSDEVQKMVSALEAYSQAPHEISDLDPHERQLMNTLLIECVRLQLKDTEIIRALKRITDLCCDWLARHPTIRRTL
jgi:hypothetical protein